MSRQIEDLLYYVERAARSLLLAAHAEGLSLSVTSTLRTEDEQVAYFSQHRGSLVLVNLLRRRAGMKPITESENAYYITQNDGVFSKSAHQWGKAFDVVILDRFGNPIWKVEKMVDEYKLLGKLARQQGFLWGGDFTPIDAVTGIGFDPFHMEMT